MQYPKSYRDAYAIAYQWGVDCSECRYCPKCEERIDHETGGLWRMEEARKAGRQCGECRREELRRWLKKRKM